MYNYSYNVNMPASANYVILYQLDHVLLLLNMCSVSILFSSTSSGCKHYYSFI